MAPLPDIRLRMTMRAFAQTAVDFASPFVTIQGRGKRRAKRYLSLFTCLATRAVHLEIAYSMETDSFLNSFYRRGLPDEVISDNGRNFIGADKELKELVKQLDVRKLQVSTANLAVKWHFNPPYAPHFGDIHETMIKAAKRAVYAILSNADITDEELLTAFVGAEGLINSRPLTYQSANPKDKVPLTPNHFLIGQMGGKFAPESVDRTSFNPQKRWRRVQELIRHFWYRWLPEWIPSLNRRQKWLLPQNNIKDDNLVLVMSSSTPREIGQLAESQKCFLVKMDLHVSFECKWVNKN